MNNHYLWWLNLQALLHVVIALEKTLILHARGGNSCGTTLERIQAANPLGLVLAQLMVVSGQLFATDHGLLTKDKSKTVGAHGCKLFVTLDSLWPVVADVSFVTSLLEKSVPKRLS